MTERVRTYERVSDDTTHIATVRIGPDGKARVPEDQLDALLRQAGYSEHVKEPTR